ncbi:PTS sugar transporter subunit IIA [Pontiella sp.]|uniref:PTS sugar transporter subunit IIA n=1 Tax=Pontiella sp. TaxID=2837462 RepID=UPI003562FF33
MEIGVKQVAELLNVSDKTIYRWIAAAQIPFYRVGSQYRFSRSEVQRWVAAQSSTPGDVPAAVDGAAPVYLEQCVRAGGIFYRVGGSDVRSVLEQQLSLMRLPPQADAANVLDLLCAREQLATTAVGEGIAFPHCRDIVLQGLASPMVSLGFLENPVDFYAIDKQPVSIVFLLLSPSAQASIRVMSRLAHAVRQPAFAALLQSVAAREKIHAALAEMDRDLVAQ